MKVNIGYKTNKSTVGSRLYSDYSDLLALKENNTMKVNIGYKTNKSTVGSST